MKTKQEYRTCMRLRMYLLQSLFFSIVFSLIGLLAILSTSYDIWSTLINRQGMFLLYILANES